MKLPRLALSLLLLLGLGRALAADAPAPAAPAAKPGFKVVVAVTINEEGVTENPRVVSSDDPSAEHLLDRAALQMAVQIKLPPRQKDGKPVKYTVQAPFVFPVEGDEGPASNQQPKPSIKHAIQPAYPEALAAQGEVGAAIVEIVVGMDGRVASANVLRSTHQEFADAAVAALKQWEFVPGSNNGTPVETRWRVAMNFATTENHPGWQWKIPPRPSLGSYTVVRRTEPAAGAGPAEISTKAPAAAPAASEKK